MEQISEQIVETFRKQIKEFEEVGHNFVNGTISSAEFKASSGGMGVYAQRGGKKFMIRLRVLSGVLDYETLQFIHEIAKEYSLKSIHLTTRQAIQIHDLKFDEVISIMTKSLEHGLYTRGGGGNFPRNVSLSPLSGVEKNEAFDVTPYAILVNKYFVSNMNTYKLPRKFKVAFSNSSKDTANASIADLGFLAVKQDQKEYFQVYIGGSLGANGDISVPYDERIETEELLYHVEAVLKLFVEEGDYHNKGKARMRFIVKRMGKEAFLECYKQKLNDVRKSKDCSFKYVNDYEVNAKGQGLFEVEGENIIPQKQEGLYTLNLHPQGGLLQTTDLGKIVAFLENIPDAQIRLTMEESMFIRNLNSVQAQELLDITKELRNTTRLGRSISCIGVPTCQIGIGNSQALLNNILTTFQEKGLREDILPSLHISGCLHSCARHQVSELGLQGKKKRVKEEVQDVYALHIGGIVSAEDTHLAKEYGELLAAQIPEFLYELALELKGKEVEFMDYVNRYPDEFKTILDKYLV